MEKLTMIKFPDIIGNYFSLTWAQKGYTGLHQWCQ